MLKNTRYHFFIYTLFLIGVNSLLFPQTMNFNHLTVKDGLSSNDVSAIIQDNLGFIWFGSNDGLNRYDGYNFKIFRHISNNSNSLSDNIIWALSEDRKGNIWIGTKAGVLNKFDPISEKFTHWKLESDLTEENSIQSIYEDRKGNIWIGTYKDGLYRLNPSTNKLDHWGADKNDPIGLGHNYVQTIIEDNNDDILIGTYIGLNKFNPEEPEKGFEHFFESATNKNSLSNNIIWRLSHSSTDSNIIWIGTSDNITKYNSENSTFERVEIPNPNNLQYGKSSSTIIEEIIDGEQIIWVASYSGLIKMNLSTGKTIRFVQDEVNESSILSNQINNIMRDRTGVLWIVTENGISFNTPKSTLFNSVIPSDYGEHSVAALDKKNITAIAKLNDDRIWIGTTNGLYSLNDITSNPILTLIPEFNGIHIWSIESTDENNIWVGTYGKGLTQFNFNKNETTKWDLKNPRLQTQSLYYNKSLLLDKQNNIWVGYWGVGASRINPKTGKSDVWLYEPNNPKSINHNDVWVIKEDRFGRIWLGTLGGGLNLFEDKNGGNFQHWLQDRKSKNSLSSNNIYSICESKNINEKGKTETTLWLGTSNGLNKLIVKPEGDSLDMYNVNIKFEHYSVSDGLPDNFVNSIIEDDNGNLWLGTGSGITFFEVNKKIFTNFSSADGINGILMNPESALRLDNGLILFGGTKGLNITDPNNIRSSSFKPNTIITDFQIFNQSVNIGENSHLKESIIYSDEIKLAYDQDVFSFEFAALDYNSSESIQYAYKMEGFDNDWIYSGTRRFVTYTNLDPGTYTFKIKSTNADGIWNEEVKSINIVMAPPWWKSIWAYGLYFGLILIGLFGIRHFELNRTKLRNELKLREFEAEKLAEIEEVKSRFFANLSHEFRTPLMLIKGPLEQLKLGGNKQNNSENLELIERNSDRLKDLIDQLLELSQLENASIPIRAKQFNLISTLKGLFSSFESFAEQKKIQLKFESNSDSIIAWIDIDKFEKVINNLLSNALKFTKDGGKVKIEVNELLINEKQLAEIKISDSGISIPVDKLDKIFDRFFQVEDSNHRSYGGSGIGLALVKEFVDLHKWEISVKSEEGEGTEFKIKIPLWDDYLKENEKVKTKSLNNILDTNFTVKEEQSTNSVDEYQDQSKSSFAKNNPSILIVDDSDDVRKYISGLLEDKYVISEAVDGTDGIKVAIETIPDLIICDVMMPLMDGMEFCQKIKSDWKTSDIPVILLTAKASFESKIEGLEIGADDYLTKPFDSRELFTRIKNLLEQRRRIRKKYSKDLELFTESGGITTADDDFIKKAHELIEKNLDKTDFSTEILAKELFVSRTQLHRKIHAITGQAPGEFVRIIKLKRAAKLILEKRLSITQIAYEIGFSSPAQFTRAFTKQFDCLPSEFSSNFKR